MGNATTTKTTFSRETRVSIDIDAPAQTVWDLLTDPKKQNEWNSTLVSLDGDIKTGGTVKLVAQIAPERTFKIKVKSMDAPKRMVWGDMQGNREFVITEREGGVTFAMNEKMGGLLFPLFAKMIPPFDDAFNQYAADLKSAAESQ